ncbi:Pirin C-terminal domain [Arabidopsis thaliana x Arabidopsis arenosa]|uniref:Pirin C-terminal domain n=1 Tax=Arabidopsis thaliana x Arabidopsis arenosa TaxID=1240361 RepID=A0A8T1ZTG2_9BRAS|nr:Pirin C-terminal domain [Arabidopsis thaliana x Arabidopsis arenosa]
MLSRKVIKKIYADFENEGDGALVRRGITKSDQELLDPFVSLVEFSVSPPGGFKDHPHRGFESVTYMLQGGIIHQDFNGNKGTIHEGDVQWMTAGRGIIHSEMPEEQVNKGLQLWINLPSSDKMIEPKNLEMSSSEIPRAEEYGVEVKVIAGESMGVKSPFYTKTPIMFLDFTLDPRAQTHQTVPESWTAFAYIIEGDEGGMKLAWNTSSSRSLRFLLIAGEPIGEPVVERGPFVMNSQAEIDMTIRDYRNAQNGFEMAKHWRSE